MKAIEIDLQNIPSALSLYRQLTRKINKLPLDNRTSTLLHKFKHYKYQNTKFRNNEIYYTKLNYYYLHMMDKVIAKQDDDCTQELLNIAYIKTVPTKSRVPAWYTNFVNLNKNDVQYIGEHKLWPTQHLILQLAKRFGKPFTLLSETYHDYLHKQQLIRNMDKTVLDLYLEANDRELARKEDTEISELINISLLRDKIEKDESIDKAKKSYYTGIIKKMAIFLRQITNSNNYGKQSIQDIKILQVPNLYGMPLPKRRSYNLLVRKIRYYKNLMYSSFEPVSFQDFKYLEKIADGELDEELMSIKKFNKASLSRFKKRCKNFLRISHCFDLLNSDEVLIFSKYRVLKTNYYLTSKENEVSINK